MNIHELPMIIFTVLAQMSVGAFVTLGVIQVFASRRYGKEAVDAVTDPALYAIGPVMVLGLAASTLHMNDLSNTLNVVRNVGSSWLSREIVLGAGFAGLGFAFALAQWLRWGSTRLRQALALLTAVVGLGLVTAMSMIYYVLTTVPAWNTWATPVQFFTTTFLLGSLAVGAALMGTLRWREPLAAAFRSRLERPGRVAASLRRLLDWRAGVVARSGQTAYVRDEETTRELLRSCLKGLGVAAIVMLGVQFITIPMHIANLNAMGGLAAASAEVYSGAWFVARLALVFAGAGLLMVFLFRYASAGRPRAVTAIATSAFALALAGEFIGRSLFYDSMLRIGM